MLIPNLSKAGDSMLKSADSLTETAAEEIFLDVWRYAEKYDQNEIRRKRFYFSHCAS